VGAFKQARRISSFNRWISAPHLPVKLPGAPSEAPEESAFVPTVVVVAGVTVGILARYALAAASSTTTMRGLASAISRASASASSTRCRRHSIYLGSRIVLAGQQQTLPGAVRGPGAGGRAATHGAAGSVGAFERQRDRAQVVFSWLSSHCASAPSRLRSSSSPANRFRSGTGGGVGAFATGVAGARRRRFCLVAGRGRRPGAGSGGLRFLLQNAHCHLGEAFYRGCATWM